MNDDSESMTAMKTDMIDIFFIIDDKLSEINFRPIHEYYRQNEQREINQRTFGVIVLMELGNQIGGGDIDESAGGDRQKRILEVRAETADKISQKYPEDGDDGGSEIIE